MQMFHAGSVEVDRCPFCGGLWFDAGELERAAGRQLQLSAARGVTKRRCPSCTTTMSTGAIDSTQLEQCGSCQGIYLDDEELQAVAKRNVELIKQNLSRAGEVTFRCVGCREDRPEETAAMTLRGLACPNCYGAMNDAPNILPAPGARLLRGRTDPMTADAGDFVVAGLGGFLWSLFS